MSSSVTAHGSGESYFSGAETAGLISFSQLDSRDEC